MKKSFYTTLLVLSISMYSVGQVKFHKGDAKEISKLLNVTLDRLANAQYRYDISTPIPQREMGEDKYGIPQSVSYKIENKNKSSNWSVEIISKNAVSLDLHLTDIDIKEGSNIYISNADKTTVMGPINSSNIGKLRTLSTIIFEGNSLYIQVIEPAGNYSSFTISQIVHGIKRTGGAESSQRSFGITSTECIPSATCYLSTWGNEIEATGLITISGSQGSGTFLNNELQNRRPFFLTAFHVLDADNNGSLSTTERNAAATCNVVIDFRRTACTGGTIASGTTLTGAVFRSAWSSTDFALIELSATPQIGLRVNYAGWSRSGSTPSTGHVLHHPANEHMRYTSSTSTGLRVYPVNWKYFEIVNFAVGYVTGGSSGSALYNDSRQVVGQLKGGLTQNSCGTLVVSKQFGRFYDSWDGGGTSDTQLRAWLSPTSNLSSMNTFVPLQFSNINYLACNASNTTITLPNVLPGETASWSVSAGLSIVSSTFNSVTIKASGTGSGSATVTATFGASSISKTVLYGKPTFNLTYQDSASANNPVSSMNYPNQGEIQVQLNTLYLNTLSGNVQWNPSPIWYGGAGGPANTVYTMNLWPGESITFSPITAVNACGSTSVASATFTVPISLLAYPNPATSLLNVSNADIANISRIDIYSMNLNSRVKSYSPAEVSKLDKGSSKSKISLDIKGLNFGIYYLHVYYKNGKKPEIVKFIKE